MFRFTFRTRSTSSRSSTCCWPCAHLVPLCLDFFLLFYLAYQFFLYFFLYLIKNKIFMAWFCTWRIKPCASFNIFNIIESFIVIKTIHMHTHLHDQAHTCIRKHEDVQMHNTFNEITHGQEETTKTKEVTDTNDCRLQWRKEVVAAVGRCVGQWRHRSSEVRNVRFVLRISRCSGLWWKSRSSVHPDVRPPSPPRHVPLAANIDWSVGGEVPSVRPDSSTLIAGLVGTTQRTCRATTAVRSGPTHRRLHPRPVAAATNLLQCIISSVHIIHFILLLVSVERHSDKSMQETSGNGNVCTVGN